ncbi:DUF2786 domain-containing protein [Vibrio cholerae]|uniref:DUF2786 domain-containing protein n=1 Tax=Vibrio cholerae TaxID=666 RepID=UPI000E0A45F3|nr:DUF2786 domain-containing protein [Vibrio cholerae]
MTDNAKVIDKIKKLLSLAESSNPNEALLAAKRARRLMDQHSISKQDIENAGSKEFLESKSEYEYRQRNAWVIKLQNAVAELNDCIGVIEWCSGSVMHKFRGFTADAVVAKMTLDYLIETCNRCCNEADVYGRSEKNQFRLGFARVIAVKVYSIIAEREEKFVSTTGTNIIPLKLNQIKNHFGELSTDKGVKSREPTLSEMEAYMSGVMAGSKTGLDKQIDGEETAKLVNF